MENKKTIKILGLFFLFYMILSWVIVSGNFVDTGFTKTGFNQIGLFDLLLAPINVFNNFVVSVTKNIDGFVEKVSYGNILVAFISIGIFYGVLNKTDAYYNLVIDIKNKFSKKREVLLLSVAIIYYIISSLTGLNLLLFWFFPFICAVFNKLKFNKITIFTSTIGAMLIGQLGSLYNPTINGVNRVLFNISINDSIIIRSIFSFILLIVLLVFLFINDNKTNLTNEEVLLFDDKKKLKNKKGYYPIIIVTSIISIILIVCMYNWYYMFDNAKITSSYNTIMSTGIKDYHFMKNILGISEAFGYWTGFSMSALLILSTVILSFLYRIKIDEIIDGAKRGIKDLIPTTFISLLSLSIIVISLYNSNSFIYSVINNIFRISNHSIGLFLSGILHNFFINDYFALLSSLSSPILTIVGIDNISLSLLITQVSHGLVSLITPFNIFLVSGLAYLNISFTSWIKYIWKVLLIIIVLSILILLLAALLI